MKRSEILKLIAGLYTVGNDFDPETRAENLLCRLEEKGMLPPKIEGNGNVAFFETETGGLILGPKTEWEPEDD